MSNNKYDIDGLIRYFEMAYKVMGYTNPEENSYEYHAVKMLKQMQESQEKMRHMILALESENDNLARDYALVVSQRDEARREILESLHPDLRKSYAAARGWDGLTFYDWEDVKTTQYWCDDCGDAIEVGNEFFYAELPCDITSANKGESATVCRKCNERIEADYYNHKFRTTNNKD